MFLPIIPITLVVIGVVTKIRWLVYVGIGLFLLGIASYLYLSATKKDM